jgi:hypothetical protein
MSGARSANPDSGLKHGCTADPPARSPVDSDQRCAQLLRELDATRAERDLAKMFLNALIRGMREANRAVRPAT